MLKKLILKNWKSFRHAELPIDSLTVLIGANASGKSNAIEAFYFLQQLIKTNSLSQATKNIRGYKQRLAYNNNSDFEITSILQSQQENIDYWYRCSIQVKPELLFGEESLLQREYRKHDYQEKALISSDSSSLTLGFDDIHGFEIALDTSHNSKLSLLKSIKLKESQEASSLRTGILTTGETIENIFILNPKPEKMRDYAPITKDLLADASNLAGVIAKLSEQQLSQFNQTISSYVKHLPERDIQRVWATPVGELETDAMLYCEEEWKPGEKIKIDARSMSDGTLRFIAILTALLTRPEGSQLIIEDIDDGLHPSRFDLLLKMLQEIGSQRQIDILVTTHNPAFLDRLSPDMTPFIIVAHRDPKTGESRLTPLEEIDNFPKLYASDSIGNLVTQGAIERSAARTSD
ncbi:MAG: AAA family ATPase [Spirulinaceae cyanobacterium]